MWFASGVTASKQGQRYLLAMTQNHHLIDELGYWGRRDRVGDRNQTSTIIHETTFEQHRQYLQTHHAAAPGSENGGGHNGARYPAHVNAHGGVTLQIFEPPHHFRSPHAWGMTIDMNTCIGCGACVMACVAENNIPVVGKEQVLANREMHWLRIDRYFKAEGEEYETQITDPNPDVVLQPMMCVHCENAPCEQVCPVAATLHDSEGLNVMVYNRCIGTRYCSNNCPYKVRKFNYLDWWAKDPRKPTYDATWLGMPDQQQHTIDAIRQMVFNPEVTVRMRGVMEKCTYCVQRIKLKTIWRRNRGEEIRDGDIKTACQMACPTETIVFGNLLDETARVTSQQNLPRAYAVLDELNTRPRTRHLARLRNREPVAQAATGH
jgi:molybdopterin-containing oxidoreductase family iron-sulfur binding subunit